MSREIAENLFARGRSHVLSAGLLHEATARFAEQNNIPDPENFAFNGTFSLSLYYLISLGTELLLKAAYVLHGGRADDAHLQRAIGHDLVKALNHAEAQGFVSDAPNLRQIVEYLRQPFLDHFFRYVRVEEMPLPDPMEVFASLQILDEELLAAFGENG